MNTARDLSVTYMLAGIVRMLFSIGWMYLLSGARCVGFALSDWATGELVRHLERVEGRR